jgi:beta-xylosidase
MSQSGSRYLIEQSEDLVNWTAFKNILGRGDEVQIAGAIEGVDRSVFYRASGEQ